MENYTVRQLGRLFAEKKISPKEHAEEMFRKIRKENERLHAFVYLMEEEAMKAAARAEQDFMDGIIRGPFQGITMGFKDLIWTKDAPVTMECPYYYEHPLRPDTDAEIVRILREQGAVIVGKTNTHALGMGSTGDVGVAPCARNPYNTEKITGGSSSGSGAAMSAGLCDITFGHDTGGSLRIPAALCGVTGIKPTFGRVSKYGLSGMALSGDVVGPIAACVEDSALALGEINGYDRKDVYSLKAPQENYLESLDKDGKDMRIAVPMAWIMDEPLDPEMRRIFLNALELFRELGAQIIDVSQDGSMPMLRELTAYKDAYQTIMSADAYMLHHEAYTTEPEKIPEGPRARMKAGNVSAYERGKAFEKRGELRQIFNRVFEEADVFLTPATQAPACDFGLAEQTIEGCVKPSYQVYTEYTWQASLSGLPAISVPAGMSQEGLPCGIMLTGDVLEEKKLYHAAYAFEQAVK